MTAVVDMETVLPIPEDSSILIPIVFIVVTLLIIALFFYKRAINEFRINQVDSLDKAFQQQHERIPCVISDFPTPHSLWTDAIVKSRSTLATTVLEDGDTLQTYITMQRDNMSDIDGVNFSEQTGINLWANHAIFPTYKLHTTFANLYSNKTTAYAGPRGLHKTTAVITLIIPTDGSHTLSIMHEESEPYLPDDWRGRQLGDFTIDDTPLLGHIDYMDIIMRPGNAILLPAHWTYCIAPKEDGAGTGTDTGPIFYIIVEFHHPISSFVDRVLSVRGLK